MMDDGPEGKMRPRDYELHVAEEFRRRGFEVEPGSEWGIDLFAVKGAERVAVQCKMYGDTTRPVNRAMIMELEGARRYFDCTDAALVTNGRVLPDAEQAALKLGIAIEQLDAAGATPTSQVAGQNTEAAHFEDIWTRSIMPLAGSTLTSSRGESTQVLGVDWSGVKLVNTTGNERFVRIEIFREVVNRLFETGVMSREEISDNYVGRASSAVCLILSQVPSFQYGGKPGVLRYRRDTAPTAAVVDATPHERDFSNTQPVQLHTTPVVAASEPVGGPATRHDPMSLMLDKVRTALSGPGRHSEDSSLVPKDGPGLYAVYAAPGAWEQLGLGAPPDDRPLYIGKADGGMVARDVRQHFRTGYTGSSTLRRSLAALLSSHLGLQARPRNPANPQHFSKYALTHHGEMELTEWMRKNLRVALWVRPGSEDNLVPLQDRLLQHWQPPLNRHGVTTPWSSMLSEARTSMSNQARGWRP